MPRYTVHVRGEWLAVPCRDAQLSVGWLGREAVRRYVKNKPDNGGFASADDVHFLVRRCKGLGLLDHEDPLEVALEDNEFVEVGEWPQRGVARREAAWPGLVLTSLGGRFRCHLTPGKTRAGCVQAPLGPRVPQLLPQPCEKGPILVHLLQRGSRHGVSQAPSKQPRADPSTAPRTS